MAMRPTRVIGGTNPTGRQRLVVRPVYEDIKPLSERIHDQESDIILIPLPGFSKENLKVSTESRNIIRVRGERLVAGNKWHRFQEDFQVSDSCNLRGTRARFEGGTLTITVPRKSVAGPKDESKPTIDQKQPSPLKNQDYNNSPKIAQTLKDEEPLLPKKTPQVNLPPLSPKVPGIKGEDHYLPPVTPKMFNEENPPRISGEKQTVEKSSEAADFKPAFIERKAHKAREDESKDNTNSQIISAEHIVQRAGERTEIDEVKGKLIAEKSKLEKKRVGFAEEDKAEYLEKKPKHTSDASSSGTGHFGLVDLKKSVKSLAEKDEERQLLVNVGVAVLVIVALGSYVCNKFKE